MNYLRLVISKLLKNRNSKIAKIEALELRAAMLTMALGTAIRENDQLKAEIYEYQAIVRELSQENIILNNQMEAH
jgi:hypothetical protein